MKKSTAGKKKIVIIAAFVILIAVMAAMFMIVRYTPTKAYKAPMQMDPFEMNGEAVMMLKRVVT